MSCKQLAEWFLQEKHTDITFALDPPAIITGTKRDAAGEQRISRGVKVLLHGHKSFLASKCPGFEKLFFAEGFADRLNLPPDVDVDEFRDFVAYLYTDILESSSLSGVFKHAMEYQVDINPADFQRALNSTNVLHVFEIARNLKADLGREFLKILEDMISDEAFELLPRFALTPDLIERESALHILNIPDLNIQPVPLINAIDAFVINQCKLKGVPVTLKSKQAVLGVSLSSLRCVQEVYDDIKPAEYTSLLEFYGRRESLLTEAELQRMNPATRPSERQVRSSVTFNNAEILEKSSQRLKGLITVLVKDSKGNRLEINVRPNYTLDMLKGRLVGLSGIPPEDQHLFLFGARLKGSLKLSEYGILDGSIVCLNQFLMKQ